MNLSPILIIPSENCLNYLIVRQFANGSGGLYIPVSTQYP